MNQKGVVSAGHKETATAAAEVLRSGGNAFDAIIAALNTAFVAEPVLASLGGGGFLLAKPNQGNPILFDFFTQTPKIKRHTSEIDFHPIVADFGTTQQEFNIGLGSIATPGALKGLFAIHNDLGSMPLKPLFEHAINLAKNGSEVNHFQAHIFDVVAPIYSLNHVYSDLFQGNKKHTLPRTGDSVKQIHLADTLDAISIEGDDLFYKGEIGQRLHHLCESSGGHIRRQDLEGYEVIKRQPLIVDFDHHQLICNPPPSSGGTLIALACKLAQTLNLGNQPHGSYEHLSMLINIIDQTNLIKQRTDHSATLQSQTPLPLDQALLSTYSRKIAGKTKCFKGTTHINVMDKSGNSAAMSISNGEGCGYAIPNTGIMMNNMLGEEDLHNGGFHQWQADSRLTSMMSPTFLVNKQNDVLSIGSGGSNRIRTAIFQVLSNICDFNMGLNEAVMAPRIHFESSKLNIEPGFKSQAIKKIIAEYENNFLWNELSLFFGGTHATQHHKTQYSGIGDPRRGGCVQLI